MQINEAFVLESTGLSNLTDIARRAAGVDNLELGQWHVEQIGGGLGNPVSVGLYRVAGHGGAGGEPVFWSSILKVIQSPANAGYANFGEAEDPAHWNYWKRELFVYRSGFLDTLPAGMVAPRCYAIHELPGDVACLWLEEVTDAYGDDWSLERYALAARHLGRLNGRHAAGDDAGRLLEKYPWLARRRLRQWRDTFPEWRTVNWDHPLVRARYPVAEIGNMRRVLLESEDFLDRIERLPLTLCHGDAYPTNFKSHHAAGGEVTVALDWALAHVGPVGYDLGSLMFGAYLNRPEVDLAEVESALFTAYMAGLGDSGCRIAGQEVRFGYSTSAVLLIALFQLMMLNYQIEQGDDVAAEAMAPVNARPCFEGAMADIACDLLDLI